MSLKERTALAEDAAEAFAIAALIMGEADESRKKDPFTFCAAAQPYFTRAQRDMNKAIRKNEKKEKKLLVQELCEKTLGVSWQEYNALAERIHAGLKLSYSPVA